MIEQTVEKMRSLRLSHMARSLSDRHHRGELQQMSAVEGLSLLVDDEWTARHNRRLQKSIQDAGFKPEGACLENVIYREGRGFTRSCLAMFRGHEWIRSAANTLVFGPTGAGKTYLAEAVCLEACKLGYSAQKISFKRLLEEIKRSRAVGGYLKYAERLRKVSVLLLDDFAMAPIGENELSDLCEILEDRNQRRPTLVTSQYPMEAWLSRLPEPTMAEAICDRLKHNAYVFNLRGESMREIKSVAKSEHIV